MQAGIATADVTNVALEVLDIDRIKSNDGGVEADISFSQLVAKVERTAGFCKVSLCAIKRFEKDLDVLLVRFLRAKNG